MKDDYYPTVDTSFLLKKLNNSKMIAEKFKIGSTYIFVLKESYKQVSSRTILLRRTKSGVTDFMMATSIAYRINCMKELLNWFEAKRNWKDGAYV